MKVCRRTFPGTNGHAQPSLKILVVVPMQYSVSPREWLDMTSFEWGVTTQCFGRFDANHRDLRRQPFSCGASAFPRSGLP